MELGGTGPMMPGGPIRIDGGMIDVSDGSVRVSVHAADGRSDVRVVGPGVPLAATRTGRFIAAVARKRNRRPYEMPAEFVVYHVVPR